MPIGFGFSVGDILATLKLVGTVIDSLRESSHAGSNFRSLIQELYALETALLHVKRLELDESQNADKVALRNTACQCQRTIDAFYAKIQKYQPHLRDGGTGSRLRDGWAKIKWAVCRQDDVDTFRAEIQGHTSSIGILLATVHMRTQATGQSRSDLHQKRLGSTIQAMLREVVQKLGQIAGAMAQSVEQGKALLESSAQIVQSNMRIFQAVQQLETILRTVPPQILLQQPVYLVDAFNKPCPFHLESIRSAEALLAFLKVNLQGTGCGSGMVDREEFVIEDAGTHRSIDLTQSWDTCFFPGQRVVMSMVFRQPVHEASCPRCSAIHAASIKEQVACTACGVIFRQIEEVVQFGAVTAVRPEKRHQGTSSSVPTMSSGARTAFGPFTPCKRSSIDHNMEHMAKFRRVTIITKRLRRLPYHVRMFREKFREIAGCYAEDLPAESYKAWQVLIARCLGEALNSSSSSLPMWPDVPLFRDFNRVKHGDKGSTMLISPLMSVWFVTREGGFGSPSLN